MIGVAPHAQGLRPRPLQGLDGSGPWSAGQTLSVGCTPIA